MFSLKIVGYNIISGSLAALGAVCGKYSQNIPEIIKQNLLNLCKYVQNTDKQCKLVLKSASITFFIIMILLNTIMMSYFVESMHLIGPLRATVLNYAFNFLFSALFGNILFGETLSLKWWMGASMILAGILLLTINKYDENANKNKNSSQPKSEHSKKQD